jgi:hypothetical protein
MPVGAAVDTIGALLYKGTGVGKVLIPDLQEIPDMMGESDDLDTTTTGDTVKTSKKGLKDPGKMPFTFLFTGMTGTNWTLTSAIEATGAPEDFTLLFPDGSGFTFTGYCSLSMPGKGVNEVFQFTASINLTTAMVPITGGIPPVLTFTCVDGTGANATKIASVSPTLTGGNSYMYAINSSVPAVGTDLTGTIFSAYTLAADIPCVNGQSITLVEVSTGDVTVKAGQSTTVVA